MSYLAFIVATGFYLFLGPAGPLHNDSWHRRLRRRVDAIQPDFWLGFVLLAVVPALAYGFVFSIAEVMIGGAAMLLLGTAGLYFSFGRVDLPLIMDKFISRSRVGDNEGACLVLAEAGMPVDAEDVDEFCREAAKSLQYENFQRWFAPVFYFFLLGPAGAVLYRLIQMGAKDREVPVKSLNHLVDWLPSRLLVITWALLGRFEPVRKVLVESALDADIDTEDFLYRGLDAATDLEDSEPGPQVESVRSAGQQALILWVIAISVVSILS